jgi:hypothetical protein
MKIITNDFVKRQTADSRFSHFEGTWEELVERTTANFESRTQGYRDGVVLVTVTPKGFFSGVVHLRNGDKLVGGFEHRRMGEAPRKFVTTQGIKKLPAKHVDVILYSSEVLSEDNDNQLPPDSGNWEIISINAAPTKGTMPIDPMVLMHNHFGSDGGTETGLSDHDFVDMLRESFLFWKDKAMCG